MMKVTLPELGEGIDKATITYWHFEVGDSVQTNDDLVEVATDKATFNVPSPCSGILTEVTAPEGETIHVGEVMAVIDEDK